METTKDVNDLKHLEKLRKECLENGDNLQAFEITIKINKLKKEIIAGRAGFKFKKYEPSDKFFIRKDYNYILDTNDDIETEINSLEDLMNFVKEYGEIILHEGEIQIFNDYL